MKSLSDPPSSIMELQAFDLLWLPDPVESCLHDGTRLEIHEATVSIEGPRTERYVLEMAYCPTCKQWYGLLPILHEIMADFDWDASDIGGFALEDEDVTAGVDLGGTTIPWTSFGQQMRAMQEAKDRPLPSDEEIRALDQTPTTWEIGQAPATWIGEGSDVDLGYVALVHGPNLVRSTEVGTGSPFEAEQLAALVRRAAGTPQPPSEPDRPRQVRVDDETMAAALQPLLTPLNIDVEIGETPLVDEALGEITAMLLGHSAPPIFQDTSDQEIRAFVEAGTQFYENEPWTRTEGDRFLGVQIDEGDWFFANVMGQMEESPGLSLFADWLTICRFVHNQRSSFFVLADELGLTEELGAFAPASPLEAAGALEALSLDERDLLHPVDAERLNRLSIDPPYRGQYPVPRRFDADEGLVAPHFSLETYRLVIEALLIALERRRATPVTSIKTTLDIDGSTVSLRYPSDGTERPYEGAPGYRLSLRGHDDDIHSPSRIPKGERIDIEAPATALFKDVAKALGQFDDRIYEATLREWDTCLWNDRDSRRNPSPRVADLADLRQPTELEVELGGAAFSLTIDEPLENTPDEIQLAWASYD